MEGWESLKFKEDALIILDQRELPHRIHYYTAKSYQDVSYSIKEMLVRGAPAIGVAAAFAVYLAGRGAQSLPEDAFFHEMDKACQVISLSRPTAVNLFWAIARMKKRLNSLKEKEREEILTGLFQEAQAIKEEDDQINRAIALHGNAIVDEGSVILTHCNTGSLATAHYGTALGVIREAFSQGKKIRVYANETRPRLQGARLTAWELMEYGIPVTLVVDSASPTLIRDKKIHLVLVGADSIALNGDVANKIGTFMLSEIARTYKVPFYSVAPISTFDVTKETGDAIVIEERDIEEVTHIHGHQVAPDGVSVYNPAFDVTPYANLTGIITEKGIIYPPFLENIRPLVTPSSENRC